MSKTTIEWTEETWNPIRGCSRISPGCGGGLKGPNGEQGGCYAEGIAARFSGFDKAGKPLPFHGFAEMVDGEPRWTRKVELIPERLDEPLRRRRPTTWFISMSDLFHEALTFEDIAAVFGVMAAAQHHTFQILTKRSSRMREFFEWVDSSKAPDGKPDHYNAQRTAMCIGAAMDKTGHLKALYRPDLMSATTSPKWPLPNVHLGVSVELPKYKTRIDDLRACPAVVRFLSLEPLLGALGPLDLTGIHQCIAGAESGHGARPMVEDWVREIRDQAVRQGVAFFYKQRLDGRGHKVSLPMLDGRTWDEMPPPVEAQA